MQKKTGPSTGTTDTYGRMKMTESLVKQHPDVVKAHRRYGRWHHCVDYRPFAKTKLIKKEGLTIPKGVNNYGMHLVEVRPKEGMLSDPDSPYYK